MKGSTFRLLIPLMIAVFPFFFLDIGPEPKSVLAQLYGFGHLIFFAFAAWLLSGILGIPQRAFPQQALFIILAILSIGGAIELIQPFFNRDAQWRDLGIDLLGGAIGIAFWVPARHQMRRPFRVSMQVTLVAVAVAFFYAPMITLWDMGRAARQFPVLGDFETRLEVNRWSSGVIAEGIARHGTHALKVNLGLDLDTKYHGTTLQRSFGDWRGYGTFAFSLFIPDDRPLPITVSIRDHAHFRRGGEYHDRFNQRFEMHQGWNDVTIPIADIQNAPSERKLELDDLCEVVIFTVDPPAPRQMYLDYVRLIE